MDILDPDAFFADFPNLRGRTFRVTSPATPRYNCIAWAAGEVTRFWWSSQLGDAFWPAAAAKQASITAFIVVFVSLGYHICSDGGLEAGMEKIALFATDEPTHAARQLPSGRWTSKIGSNVDIEHDLNDLEGPLYGKVACFLVRRRPTL